jgi:hypothetical protein
MRDLRLAQWCCLITKSSSLLCCVDQWRTGQGVSLPDGKWAPLNIRQYVKNVNDLLVA